VQKINWKGFIKIAAFILVVVPSVCFVLYRAYRSVSYRITRKVEMKKLQKFDYTFETTDPKRKGYLLLTSTARDAKVLIMDMAGHIVWKKALQGDAGDFRQWNFNGHIRYSYIVADSVDFQDNTIGGSSGYVVILDSALQEIRRIHLLPYNDIVINNKQGVDIHDFILLSDDHYFVMSAYAKSVSNIPACLVPAPKLKVCAVIIQEVKNGAVVWQWDATRFPEFYLNSEELNKFYDTVHVQDYMHINAITFDPRDSNIIASFRNENQVVKISTHTGEILWRLGGRNSDFPLTREQVFLRQHNPTLTDSNRTLMLFDNGEYNYKPFSRVVEFKLDEQNKKVTSFKSYNMPEPFSKIRGSVQIVDSDYLICGGSGKYILEVDRKTGAKKMEIKTNQMSLYRAYFVKDIPGVNLNQK
jgi:arylsulfate sulfotransferase